MITLDLPPQIQCDLECSAKEYGISPEKLAAQVLFNQFKKAEFPLNFDLDEIKKAIDSGFAKPVLDTP